jgi:hypothetical protein
MNRPVLSLIAPAALSLALAKLMDPDFRIVLVDAERFGLSRDEGATFDPLFQFAALCSRWRKWFERRAAFTGK